MKELDKLHEKIKQLSILSKEKRDKSEQITMEIEHLQEKLKETTNPFDLQIECLENDIKTFIITEAASIKTAYGEAIFRKGYQKITYNSKQIDIICENNPHLKTILHTPDIRKETPVMPVVMIKVY